MRSSALPIRKYPTSRLNRRTEPLPVDDRSPHAVVIGAGFGGLAAAIRLRARGYRVTVVDRLDQPGGRGRTFRDRAEGHDGDFVFDAGPTVITAPFLLEELWQLCGRKLSDDVELVPVSPFYRIRFDDGDVFDYTGDAEAMRREVARLAPEDVAGYERFVRESEPIFRVGFEQLAHVPFDNAWDMARIVPAMVKLASYRSVYGLVAKHVRSERLRQVMSFHPLLVGGNPFSTTSIYSLIAFLERKWGVHYAMGGTGSLVRGMVGLLDRMGGAAVRCGVEVQEITVGGRRATGVRLADGEHLPAEVVVSNADSAWTYKYLLPGHVRRRWTDRRVERSRYSMSLFVWYFGTDRRYEDVAHHTILLGPRYEELLRDIFDRKILAKDFSLYLHRPTATDPSMAPERCDAFYVLSPVPHLESGTDWAREAEPYRQRVARYLSDTVLPGLEEHVVTSRVLTPRGFLDDYLSFRGAAFGIEPVLSQSAWFRPHNRSEDVDGLYLVGAGTHPGAGMPGVLSSARVLDTVVPDAVAVAGEQGSVGVRADDLVACREILQRGSKSFAAASLLLPARVRGPAAAVYAFCRVADDAVDRDPEPRSALERMRERLERIYAGDPANDPVDRALAAVIARHGLAREPFDWMLEGFEWDLEGRRYETLADLRAYCVRVAATVGVVMTELMGDRRAPVLARACDLGVAMQLTNIARDVGDDVREGRLYVPREWLREAGVDPDGFVADPRWSPPIGLVVRRLLAEAQPLYGRADHGIRLLPADCRVAIRAARLVYADIGRVIADRGFDTVTDRAYTSGTRKTVLIGRAMGAATWRATEPSTEPPLNEARPLVEAVSRGDG